ncbi:MAG: hypothetical protein QOE90_1014 [Thermoplasmata archaeon]|nr:hypothetical protein [Thermoplasmata archaeon]
MDGRSFADLTHAVAPSAAGRFASALLFMGFGTFGPALFMSALAEAMEGEVAASPRPPFWMATAHSSCPAGLFVGAGAGRTAPAGVVLGTLAGAVVGALMARMANAERPGMSLRLHLSHGRPRPTL